MINVICFRRNEFRFYTRRLCKIFNEYKVISHLLLKNSKKFPLALLETWLYFSNNIHISYIFSTHLSRTNIIISMSVNASQKKSYFPSLSTLPKAKKTLFSSSLFSANNTPSTQRKSNRYTFVVRAEKRNKKCLQILGIARQRKLIKKRLKEKWEQFFTSTNIHEKEWERSQQRNKI